MSKQLEFTPLIHELSTDVLMIFNELASLLVQHKLGWSRYGYQFKKVDSDKKSGTCKHFTIMLTPSSVISAMFPRFAQTQLSVCNRRTNIIYINEARWMRTILDDSQLELPEYRAYLISHEVGHILGLGHAPVSECATAASSNVPVPTMMQQTLGIKHCKPSPWPKPHELIKYALQ